MVVRSTQVLVLAVLAAACTGSTGPTAEVTVTTPLECTTETVEFLQSAPGRVIASSGDLSRTPEDVRAGAPLSFQIEEITLSEEVVVAATCFTFVEAEQTIERFWRVTLVSALSDRVGGLYEVLWIGEHSWVTLQDESLRFSRAFLLDDRALVDGAEISATWGGARLDRGGGVRLELNR